MKPEKNNYSDTSTVESDQRNDDGAAARSYDCGFCKRGFTNAQALGGHMNIHRKDKAKAKTKHKNHENPLIQSFNSNSTFSPGITTMDYSQVFKGHVSGYQVYVPPSNPSTQTRNYEYCFFPDNLGDRTDGNLSLMIGDVEDEEEVDLELRLGRQL